MTVPASPQEINRRLLEAWKAAHWLGQEMRYLQKGFEDMKVTFPPTLKYTLDRLDLDCLHLRAEIAKTLGLTMSEVITVLGHIANPLERENQS